MKNTTNRWQTANFENWVEEHRNELVHWFCEYNETSFKDFCALEKLTKEEFAESCISDFKDFCLEIYLEQITGEKK